MERNVERDVYHANSTHPTNLSTQTKRQLVVPPYYYPTQYIQSVPSSFHHMDDFVLDNHGIVVERRPGLGRVAVATRDFDVLFEKILRERPVLVWSKGKDSTEHYVNYIQAFSEAPAKVKHGILQLFHPPIESADQNTAIFYVPTIAKSIAHRFPSQSLDDIEKLLAICITNAHSYFGADCSILSKDAGLTQYETVGGNVGPNKVALFLFGSMPQHSCSPNVSYTSQTPDGALEYKVTSPIKAGDPICFAYIDGLAETPTYQRRARLITEKSFLCQCSLCMAPDFTRIATCLHCKAAHPCASRYSTDPEWQCANCLAIGNTITRLEQDLEKAFGAVKSMLTTRISTLVLVKLRNECTVKLSPTHFLALESWSELARLYASKAVEAGQRAMFGHLVHPLVRARLSADDSEGLSVEQLRQQAAICGLRSISLRECVLHQCRGCPVGAQNHPACYGLISPVFHACMD